MHGVLGPNAPKHVEEELDTALEKLNKKHKTEENHALEVPTEQFLVTNKAVQVFFCNMTINGHLIVMYCYYTSLEFLSIHSIFFS